ncbi:hypothetical protein ACQR1L_09895 [Bradyrhizobium sp. HKCCYLR20261]
MDRVEISAAIATNSMTVGGDDLEFIARASINPSLTTNHNVTFKSTFAFNCAASWPSMPQSGVK